MDTMIYCVWGEIFGHAPMIKGLYRLVGISCRVEQPLRATLPSARFQVGLIMGKSPEMS